MLLGLWITIFGFTACIADIYLELSASHSIWGEFYDVSGSTWRLWRREITVRAGRCILWRLELVVDLYLYDNCIMKIKRSVVMVGSAS